MGSLPGILFCWGFRAKGFSIRFLHYPRLLPYLADALSPPPPSRTLGGCAWPRIGMAHLKNPKEALKYHTILYSTLLYSPLLYSTLLFSPLLLSPLLFCSLLSSPLLYSDTLPTYLSSGFKREVASQQGQPGQLRSPRPASCTLPAYGMPSIKP